MMNNLTHYPNWKQITYMNACLQNTYDNLRVQKSIPVKVSPTFISVPLGTNSKGERQVLQTNETGTGWELLTSDGVPFMSWYTSEAKLWLRPSRRNPGEIQLYVDDTLICEMTANIQNSIPLYLYTYNNDIPRETLNKLTPIVQETIESTSPYNVIAKDFTLNDKLDLARMEYAFRFGYNGIFIILKQTVLEDDRLGVKADLHLGYWNDDESELLLDDHVIDIKDISLYGLLRPVVQRALDDVYQGCAKDYEDISRVLGILDDLYQVAKVNDLYGNALLEPLYKKEGKQWRHEAFNLNLRAKLHYLLSTTPYTVNTEE